MFKEEIKRVTDKINKLKNENTFIFSIVTDIHLYPMPYRTDNNLYYSQSVENMRAVNSQTHHDILFHLGDVLGVGGFKVPPEYWTREKVEATLMRNRRDYENAFEKVYYVAGNHDGDFASVPIPDQWYRLMLAHQGIEVKKEKDTIYYYVDFPEKKVRAICLMSSYHDGNGSYFGYDKPQLEWLCKEALMVPQGYKILVFSHISPIDVPSRKLDNVSDFRGVFEAYKNRTSFEGNRITVDFSDAKGELVAHFGGHTHADWVAEKGAFPMRVIETASNLPHYAENDWKIQQGAISRMRNGNENDKTADLWDTVVYDMKKNTLEIIRFGSGEDRRVVL